MPDVIEAAKDADILIFVVPHQFIRRICSTLLGKIKPTAVGLSLIKVNIIIYYGIVENMIKKLDKFNVKLKLF